jgi:predicted alpha/beta-fold hydrolase
VAESLDLSAPDSASLYSAQHMADEIMPLPFKPAWWLRNPHLQTLWPVLFRRKLRPPLRRERLELPDGDFVDLDWTVNDSGPIVIIFHGLEGSSRSHYTRGILSVLPRQGMRAVVMHFRGCSGEPNRLARAYHSGDTGDIDFLVRTLKAREPSTPLAAIGYSLGGNALLKWLGEQGSDAPVQCAVAVSVPFLLHEATARMNRGFSCVYQWHLMKSLKRGARRKAVKFTPPATLKEIDQMKSFFEFDDRVTARLHGFNGAMHYYTTSSSRQYLNRIRIPTLIVHAQDDPFMHPGVIPGLPELSSTVELSLHARGGHVGFVGGSLPWRPRYWLDEQLPFWLKRYLHEKQHIGL